MATPADENPRASSIVPNGTPLDQRHWPDTFNPPEGMFPPGEPLWPLLQEPIRTFDFRVGLNNIITPRTGEYRGFAELRAFSNVELVRLAIETRKDQIGKLDFQIKPRDDKKKHRKDYHDRIKSVTKFLKKPDGVHDFHEWLRLLLEDLFTIDAPCLERRRNRGGTIVGYDVVPGDTIKILVDYNGRLPLPPVPAYQQIIKGRVWCDLTTDDIIYMPRNRRPGHLYGFSPVEQVLVTVHTAMLRQASQVAYFSDGNVPAGLASVPDGWTVDQVRDWQEWMDQQFSGNLAERRKILWAPAGSDYKAFKEAPIKDDFDEWLARIVMYSFSLPPTGFIKQLNRSASQADQERAAEEGQAPLKTWIKRWLDEIIQDDLGFSDLEFAWIKEQDIDKEKENAINVSYLKSGVYLINEIRDTMGLDPVPGGDKALIYTSGGAIKLDDIINPPPIMATPGGTSGQPQVSQTKPVPATTTGNGQPKPQGSGQPKPQVSKAELIEISCEIEALIRGSEHVSASLSGR